MFERVTAEARWCAPDIVHATLDLALEIAREGREGRRIGTLFTIGNAEAVLKRTRPLILDPLAGHAPARTHITDRNLRGTMKELAQLDGGFVISDEGYVLAAARYFEAPGTNADLPLGLGSRHLAALSMSQLPRVLAVVVSESAVVRVFHDGRLIAEILPELWLLTSRRTELHGKVDEREGDVTVMAPSGARPQPRRKRCRRGSGRAPR
jgi:diadenylate cyclase